MKLLIIDDEKPVRDCIKLLIPKSTYKISEIYEAEDGLEAVQLIRQYSPDLIVTDICMPISDGLELMDWIVENSVSTPVIAISGYTDYEYIRNFFIKGGLDYILKPIQPDKLNLAVQKAQSEIERKKVITPTHEEDYITEDIFISIKKYIDQNYSNQLNLPYIASEFHLSEPYLSRKFKAKFDINIIQYIKLVRIRHAKQLLMSSGKKISEISLLVGYDDEKYFSRVFKEMEKISANDYRKKFSNK